MIKNVIFDFGDVLINLDKTVVPRGISAYGKSPEDPDLTTLAENYEQGFISTDHFVKNACNILNEKRDEELIKLWNSMITDFPLARLEFIEKLKASNRYRLFLLSNTNELHIDYVQKIMGQSIYERFQGCFEGFYLSHLIGMRKPNAEIFQFVLENHQLNAQETLFIDDTLGHIQQAQKLGIKTWHLQVGEESVYALNEHLE